MMLMQPGNKVAEDKSSAHLQEQFWRNFQELAFCCKQLASNAPETDGLEEGMAFFLTSSLQLDVRNYRCPLFPRQTKVPRAFDESISHSCHRTPQMFRCQCLSTGPPALLTRKMESKQIFICMARGTQCSWARSWAEAMPGFSDASWQEAMAQPCPRPGALKELIHCAG